ncbi:MAG: menaquinone biosynthesis protein [Armatimonadetes bacterium]|jgi:chorismate dehydratase|nr:menaquinone biosynthesis protein [Armatimonadota bacterium]
MGPYRLGVVPYLNVAPLIYDLEQNPRPDVIMSVAVPAVLIERLRAGELDAALVSSFACLGDDRLVILPGSGIAARGAVDSVRLFCATAPEALRRVALDRSSRSGATLTRILLAECYGVQPEYHQMRPDLAAMLAEADAGLLIGDPALRAHHCRPWPRADLRSLDLGELWLQLTGLPFVYGVWAARREVDSDRLVAILAEAREAGRPYLEAIADAAAARLGLPAAACRRYLCELLTLDLGEEEWEGLRRFRALAIQHGLVPRDAPPLTIRGIA